MCRFQMIAEGRGAIPRSCPTCGLGPCKQGRPDPYRPAGPPPDMGSAVQPVAHDRIAALEKRIERLERMLIPPSTMRAAPTMIGPQMVVTCACPPVLEATCGSVLCPRRQRR